jgi:hypothetical protein
MQQSGRAALGDRQQLDVALKHDNTTLHVLPRLINKVLGWDL